MTFKFEVKRVQAPEEPELNEEFFEKMTGKKQSLDEIKKEIEDSIKERKEDEAKQKLENDYVEELIKKVKVELPDSLIEDEAQNIMHDMKHDLEHRGQTWDEFLKKAKTTEEELLKKYRKEGERRIKMRFGLQELIKQEKVEVKPEELNEEIAKMKARYPESEHKKIDEELAKGNLGLQLTNKMLLDKLFQKVLS